MPITDQMHIKRQQPQTDHAYGSFSAKQSGARSSLQVLCHEVERQLNRHYKRLYAFFDEAFADRSDYPLMPNHAVMLFCIGNGVCDTVQLCRILEPVIGQPAIILAHLCAQDYASGIRQDDPAGHAAFAAIDLTHKGRAVAAGLDELYNYVFLAQAGHNTPDADKLASMHQSLYRLQKFERFQLCYPHSPM